MQSHTIAAIATPPGQSGIGIIRISGEGAFALAQQLFRDKNGQMVAAFDHQRIRYGYIVDPLNGETADEVMLTTMKAPASYTREDIVEINCHGSGLIVQKILGLALENGAQLAEPGEFTKRAFLNGRIDLSQAEAVIDYLNARTHLSMKNAFGQLSGVLSGTIRSLREDVLTAIAGIEAAIDFPDQDIPEIPQEDLAATIKTVQCSVNHLIDTFDTGKLLTQGVKMVITGDTNVGKSSLMNYFLKEERAIVTDIPGTTRDSLDAQINIGGIAVLLIDTAGIRKTDDTVERIGVEKARRLCESADLLLAVFDAATPITPAVLEGITSSPMQKVLAVVNKADLAPSPDITQLSARFGPENVQLVSIKNGDGMPQLLEKIEQLLVGGKIDLSTGALITNVRQKNCLMKVSKSLDSAQRALLENIPAELMSIDLKDAYDGLSEILGESLSEDLADKIFSEFCIGK